MFKYLLLLIICSPCFCQVYPQEINFGIRELSELDLPVIFDADGSLGLRVSATSLAIGDIYLTGVADYKKKNFLLNTTTSTQENYKIQLASQNDTYTRLRYFKWDLGLGLGITEEVFERSLSLGASPFTSKTYQSVQRLNSKYEKRKKLRIPFTNEYESWRIGDSLGYTSQNGIYLTLPLSSMSPLDISTEFIAEGSFHFLIQKQSKTDFLIHIKSSKIRQLSLQGEVFVPYLRAGITKSFTVDRSYLLNLSTHQGQNQLKLILSGNLSESESFRFHKKKQTSRTLFTHYGLRLPIVFNIMKNKSRSFSSFTTTEGAKTSIFFSDNTIRTRGSFSRKKIQGFKTFTTLYETKHQSQINSKILWIFEKKKTKGRILNNKLRRLAKKTGIKELLKIKFPARKYGFTKLVLEATRSINSIKKSIFQKKLKDKSIKMALRELTYDTKNSYLSRTKLQNYKLRFHVIGRDFKKHSFELKE